MTKLERKKIFSDDSGMNPVTITIINSLEDNARTENSNQRSRGLKYCILSTVLSYWANTIRRLASVEILRRVFKPPIFRATVT